ncbi:HNH endonuclease signature motif containing protein [Nocardiopsis ansamitocini]|uniref:HNH nuclease domain-containing protein n=1 Tax=Nocardiopsis ansamitocini TaxID=1670832 RepID=A0A9W6P2E9_9ACTN|nr:HNH endonuclease signature motif containing protein [Nocardiopsis ansamitocini]GLU45896.1 hypothetical protein Nans01_02470 [Nocardiopsis ansamitocini]
MNPPATLGLREEVPPAARSLPTAVAPWVRAVDPGALSSGELLEFITRIESARRELAAVQLAAMAAFTDQALAQAPVPRQTSAHEEAAAELGLELQLSPGAAGAWLSHASRLVADFPGIHRALADGALDESRARTICDLPPADWPAPLCAAYEARMLAEGGTRTGTRLKNLAKRVIVELDPDRARERHGRTIEARTTMVVDNHPAHGPGTASFLVADIDTVDALAVQQRLGAIARGLKRDGAAGGRSMDQLRADTAVSLLLGRLPATSGPEIPADLAEHDAAVSAHVEPVALPGLAGPRPVEFSPVGKLHVIIPLSALPAELGGATSEALAEICGHGPIRADAARALAREATHRATQWCYTVVDPDGTPLAHGLTAYRPPRVLRSHIDSRDRTCRFPHCPRPAVECDADHTRAHHRGGPTDPGNLAALCRKHHRLKQHPDWRLTQSGPGVLTWRTPHRRVHTVRPEPYPGG